MQNKFADQFHNLHNQDNPLVLYNIWDTATAKAVCHHGANAVATGSWSMAAAQGYADGQNIPLDFVVQIVSRIVSAVDVPVSVDFECGYADGIEGLADNFKKIIDTGAVGVNFEDQIIGTGGLRSPSDQARRIEVLANTASAAGVKMFINARTDMFLQQPDASLHANAMAEAQERARLYKAAGADGFFVPGLAAEALIAQICDAVTLPVNVMASAGGVNMTALKGLGVSRVSYGPHPYFNHIKAFETAAAAALS